MAYTFRMVLSGPTAYVPNRLVTVGGSASSWSAIMPFLDVGATVGGVKLAPHFSVLQFATSQFETSHTPDLRFRLGNGPEIGLFLLKGDRVRIRAAGSQAFEAHDTDLSAAVLTDGPGNDRA